MIKHILEIDSVQKSYNDKLVLSDVYLRCESSEIIGLLGRNGSGKSTLLKIIFGVEDADFKFVRINGIVKSKNAELLGEVSYLSQDNFLPAHLRVAKAIALSVSSEAIVEFYSDEFIHAIRDKKIRELSGGELRYLEVKLILSNSSKFALLDEPYNGLGPLMVEKVNDMILHHRARKGIIISDHSYESVITVSDRIILMQDARTVPIQHPSELCERGYLPHFENT